MFMLHSKKNSCFIEPVSRGGTFLGSVRNFGTKEGSSHGYRFGKIPIFFRVQSSSEWTGGKYVKLSNDNTTKSCGLNDVYSTGNFNNDQETSMRLKLINLYLRFLCSFR